MNRAVGVRDVIHDEGVFGGTGQASSLGWGARNRNQRYGRRDANASFCRNRRPVSPGSYAFPFMVAILV